MWGISGVCTLALTVAKTSSHYDRFAISVPARFLLLVDLAQRDGNIGDPKGPRGPRGIGDIPEARFMLSIILTLMVLSFFFNSRILQTGILQSGPNQFVENKKQNQDNTGPRYYGTIRHEKFAERSLVVFAETSCSLFQLSRVDTSSMYASSKQDFRSTSLK